MSIDLIQNLDHLDRLQTKQRLNEILQAGRYIEQASARELQSNESLSTGIRVTTQVTDQLVSGAKSANEAAAQLEEVIGQLRQVVGE